MFRRSSIAKIVTRQGTKPVKVLFKITVHEVNLMSVSDSKTSANYSVCFERGGKIVSTFERSAVSQDNTSEILFHETLSIVATMYRDNNTNKYMEKNGTLLLRQKKPAKFGSDTYQGTGLVIIDLATIMNAYQPIEMTLELTQCSINGSTIHVTIVPKIMGEGEGGFDDTMSQHSDISDNANHVTAAEFGPINSQNKKKSQEKVEVPSKSMGGSDILPAKLSQEMSKNLELSSELDMLNKEYEFMKENNVQLKDMLSATESGLLQKTMELEDVTSSLENTIQELKQAENNYASKKDEVNVLQKKLVTSEDLIESLTKQVQTVQEEQKRLEVLLLEKEEMHKRYDKTVLESSMKLGELVQKHATQMQDLENQVHDSRVMYDALVIQYEGSQQENMHLKDRVDQMVVSQADSKLLLAELERSRDVTTSMHTSEVSFLREEVKAAKDKLETANVMISEKEEKLSQLTESLLLLQTLHITSTSQTGSTSTLMQTELLDTTGKLLSSKDMLVSLMRDIEEVKALNYSQAMTIKDLEHALASKESGLSSLTSDCTRISNELEKMEKLNQELKSEIAVLESSKSQLLVQEALVATMQKDNAHLKREVEDWKNQVQHMSESINISNDDKSALISQLQKDLFETKALQQDLSTTVDSYSSEKIQMQSEIQAHSSKIIELQNLLESTQKELDDNIVMCSSKQRELYVINGEMVALASDWNSKLEEKMHVVSLSEEVIASLKEELRRLSESSVAKERELQEEVDRLGGVVGSMSLKIKASEDEVVHATAQLRRDIELLVAQHEGNQKRLMDEVEESSREVALHNQTILHLTTSLTSREEEILSWKQKYEDVMEHEHGSEDSLKLLDEECVELREVNKLQDITISRLEEEKSALLVRNGQLTIYIEESLLMLLNDHESNILNNKFNYEHLYHEMVNENTLLSNELNRISEENEVYKERMDLMDTSAISTTRGSEGDLSTSSPYSPMGKEGQGQGHAQAGWGQSSGAGGMGRNSFGNKEDTTNTNSISHKIKSIQSDVSDVVQNMTRLKNENITLKNANVKLSDENGDLIMEISRLGRELDEVKAKYVSLQTKEDKIENTILEGNEITLEMKGAEDAKDDSNYGRNDEGQTQSEVLEESHRNVEGLVAELVAAKMQIASLSSEVDQERRIVSELKHKLQVYSSRVASLEVALAESKHDRQGSFDIPMNVTKTIAPNVNEVAHGFLTKKGSFFPSWLRRYFVLTVSELCYYVEPGGPKKGEYKLTPTTMVSVRSPANVRHKHCLCLVDSNRILYVATETEEEKLVWLEALTYAINQIINPSNKNK